MSEGQKGTFSLRLAPEILDAVYNAKGPRETATGYIRRAVLAQLERDGQPVALPAKEGTDGTG